MKSCCGLQHRSGAGELTVLSNSAYEEGAHLSPQDVAVDSLDNPELHAKSKIKGFKNRPILGWRGCLHWENSLPCSGSSGLHVCEGLKSRPTI